MNTILLFLSLFFSCTVNEQPASVYICNSTTAKKYHLSATCKGLNNCQHKVLKVTLDKAKKDGRTLCKWED